MQYAFYIFKCICQTDISLPEPLAVTTATQSAHHNLPVGVRFACLWEAYRGCCLYSLTHKIPLSVGHVARDISLIHLEIQQPSVKRPRAEFKLALLDVKRKPAYIHVTGAHEDTWDEENKYVCHKYQWFSFWSQLLDVCTASKCHGASSSASYWSNQHQIESNWPFHWSKTRQLKDTH